MYIVYYGYLRIVYCSKFKLPRLSGLRTLSVCREIYKCNFVWNILVYSKENQSFLYVLVYLKWAQRFFLRIICIIEIV